MTESTDGDPSEGWPVAASDEVSGVTYGPFPDARALDMFERAWKIVSPRSAPLTIRPLNSPVKFVADAARRGLL